MVLGRATEEVKAATAPSAAQAERSNNLAMKKGRGFPPNKSVRCKVNLRWDGGFFKKQLLNKDSVSRAVNASPLG